MKLDISDNKFEKMSNEQKKRYVSSLLIKDSGVLPVPTTESPIAFVMAGAPGSGKTEFLNSLNENIQLIDRFGAFAHIDLDQIVTIYPSYTPKTYAKFRSQGNLMVARCVDELRRGRYNMMIDGTFSGSSGSSIRNIEKLLNNGYIVIMIYMFDDPETSWDYTKKREIETNRGIDKAGFIASCDTVTKNLREAILKFRGNHKFILQIVKQKVLRDKNYEFVSEDMDVDLILEQGYNIDRLKEIL